MKQTLDFIVVGAQKAGTTSLAAYLGEHPDVFIPPEKEVPYFVDQEMMGKGWSWFLQTYFHRASSGHLWGTSTPQYMMYPESFEAISRQLPSVRVIVMLRDPIARMLSHYDMVKRFGIESRALNEMIRDHLDRYMALRRSPYRDRTGKYLVAGEYGRILELLFNHFPRSQVLVVQFDDLKRDAQGVMNMVCDFLGLEHYSPSSLGIVRMKGGGRKKVPVNHEAVFAMASNVARRAGVAARMPDRLKAWIGRCISMFDEWNVDPRGKSTEDDIAPLLLDRLREHYRSDAEKMRRLGVDAPWLERWQ